MVTDSDLLRRYAEQGSEAAFAELVSRYINLVHASAQRRVGGDAHAAKDVAQHVFTALARDARRLTDRPALTGWLYTATRNAASHHVRGERRRRSREEEAIVMPSPEPSATDWDRLRPLIDEAMDALGGADREAVLLRYFEGRSYAEIAAALLTTEDAARVRVSRALEKLQRVLSARGIASSGAALGTVLTASASPAAPAGVAAAVIRASLTGAAAGAGGALTLGQLVPASIAVSAAVVAVVAALFQYQATQDARVALAAARAERDRASATVQELKTQLARTEALVPASDAAPAPVSATGTAPSSSRPTTVTGQRTPNAAEFLAAHPEARELLQKQARYMFEMFNGPALRALNLTPDEYVRAIAEGAQAMQAKLHVGGMDFVFPDALDPSVKTPSGTMPAIKTAPGESGIAMTLPGPPDAALDPLLGPDRAREFKTYRLMDPSRKVVGALAASSLDAEVPLTAGQTAAVFDLLSQQQTKGGINATAAHEAAQAILTPAQLSLFDLAYSQSYFFGRSASVALAPKR